MYAEYISENLSLREIGGRYGLSGSRVHQLFGLHGLTTRKVSRLTLQREEREEKARDKQVEIVETYKRLGSINATAKEVGLPAKYIKPYVKHLPGRSLYRTANVATQYSKEFILESLQRAAEIAGEPLTVPAYNALAPENGFPAHATVLHVLDAGTWYEACALAGVEANKSKGPQRGTITPDQCLEAVTRCANELDKIPTYDDYSRWAKVNDMPSGQTVRVKCDGWSTAVRDALQLTDR